jgi:hypothetical protein
MCATRAASSMAAATGANITALYPLMFLSPSPQKPKILKYIPILMTPM